jgi:epoxide hydrolase-like predicted phosphatase
MDNQFSKRPIRERKICRRYDSLPVGKIIQKPGPEPKLELGPEPKHNGNGIKCVAFDFGGVYTKRDIIHEVFDAYNARHGINPEDFWKKVHGSVHWSDFFRGKITEPVFWARSKMEFNNHDFDDLFFSQRIKDASSGINPKTRALVSRLKSMGYKTVMLTNNAREWFEPFIQGGQLKNFDFILTSYDLGLKKPERMIYDIMLNAVEVRPRECVFIDDLERNTEAARRMGMHAITFKSYEQALGELEELLGKKIV